VVKVEKVGPKAIVWIYSYVGEIDFDGPAFQLLLDSLTGCDEILIRLHTYGGSVFDGNLIYNAIGNNSTPIDIQIDGVCASMGSILIQKARRITIVANGFLMIHTPSGYTEGDAAKHIATANLLQMMQDQFGGDLGTRTGKDKAYTAKWLDGQDHWLNASECLAEGLVDEIVQSVTEAPEELTVEAVVALGPKAVFQRFTATLQAGTPTPTDNTKRMDKKKLIEKYALQGVTADSTDEQVEAALDAHFKALSDGATKNTDEAIDALIESTDADLTDEQKKQFTAVGKTMGVATLKTMLSTVKPYASVTAKLKDQQQPEAKTREGWDWDKYQAEASKELEAMEKTDNKKFVALFKAKYGTEPK